MEIDCKRCQHYQYCTRPCPAADYYANGNIQQQELPMPIALIERIGQQDYNYTLSEMIEDNRTRDANMIEAIRTYDQRVILLYHELKHIPAIGDKLVDHDIKDFYDILQLGIDWSLPGAKVPKLLEGEDEEEAAESK